MPISFYIVCFRLSTENLDGASPTGGTTMVDFLIARQQLSHPFSVWECKGFGNHAWR